MTKLIAITQNSLKIEIIFFRFQWVDYSIFCPLRCLGLGYEG